MVSYTLLSSCNALEEALQPTTENNAYVSLYKVYKCRRSAVVKHVEHISTIVLVNI